MKILTQKLMILQQCQNTKTFFQNDMFEIGLKKFLLLQKLKRLFRGQLLLLIFKVKKKKIERFTKKELQKSKSERVYS